MSVVNKRSASSDNKKPNKKIKTDGQETAPKQFQKKSPKTIPTIKKAGFKNSSGKDKFNKKNWKGGNNAGNKPVDASNVKPDWGEFKKKKKEVRTARKLNKTKPEERPIIQTIKALSERLRRKKNDPETRSKLSNELHQKLNKGLYKSLVLAHDTSRIIQWLLKFGTPEIREQASLQMLTSIVEMMQSKYARNCVKRILKYGNENVRHKVLEAMYGNIVKFSSHTLSAPILDYAYSEIADKKEKINFEQEFYGDMYKSTKDPTVAHLKDTYKNSPEMKNAMVNATKANILKVLNKNVHDCGLLHKVLYEYLNECPSDDRSEMITTLSPLVAPLSNSALGAKAAVMCTWNGTNKDKKTILKVVKEHLVQLSTHEHGHLLVLAILSSVDDTVLVGKMIVSTLLKEIATVVKEEWGRKIILWLVAPRDKSHFHPKLIEWFVNGLAQGTSKKSSDARETELFDVALPLLCKEIENQPAFWLENGSIGLVLQAILKRASGNSSKNCLDKISQVICQSDWKLLEDGKEINGIEHAGLHLCCKKIAQNDKNKLENQEYTFGTAILENLTDETIELWISTNRGCFFLITLFENNSEELQNKMKAMLKKHSKALKKISSPGSKILCTKIKE